MLKSYLKVALRNLWKNRLYTSINITGLSVGLAACVLIMLFVRDELSYDKHFKDSQRIYRLTSASNQGGDAQTLLAITTYELLPVLTANFPEMEDATRLDFWDVLVSRGDQYIWQENVMPADSLLFDLFSMETIIGDPQSAIREPNTMVLTESAAERHFQDQNPLGEILRINEMDFRVAAIVKDLPATTHFEAEMFIPMSNAIQWYGTWVYEIFTGTSHYNYFRLAEGVDPAGLEARINAFLAEKYESGPPTGEYFLQPLESIHLESDLVGEAGANGNRATVLIFIATAIVIVLLACINYINLSIAGSFQRSREVGLKKIFGARASSQVVQFQAESTLVALVSCTIAIVLVEVLMPYFNELTGKQLSFDVFQNLELVGLLLSVGLLIGLISGSFPAWFLLKIHTSQALKGNMLSSGKGRFNLRNALMVFQFFIAVILIACTFIILNQMNYLKDKDLGINSEQVVVIPMQGGDVATQYDNIRQELLRKPGVISVTGSNNHPAQRVGNWRRYRAEGQEAVSAPTVVIAHDYFETLEASIIAGRSFDREHLTDYTEAYVLNEAAVKFFDLEDPIGKNLLGRAFTGSQWSNKNAKVIGVVKDFHMASLHSEVRPTVFSLSSEVTTGLNYIDVRIAPENIRETMNHLEATWQAFAAELPFEYSFMDEDINEHYVAEDQFLSVFTTFAFLSILIGCLGLFGLTAFIMKRRTKEIGIRKVLGAEIPRLVAVLSKDFLKLVLLANLLGWPLAFYMMDRWLENFAYSAGIPLWAFAFTGFGALVIAFVSVAYHSIKTANANPVNSIRYE